METVDPKFQVEGSTKVKIQTEIWPNLRGKNHADVSKKSFFQCQ